MQKTIHTKTVENTTKLQVTLWLHFLNTNRVSIFFLKLVYGYTKFSHAYTRKYGYEKRFSSENNQNNI